VSKFCLKINMTNNLMVLHKVVQEMDNCCQSLRGFQHNCTLEENQVVSPTSTSICPILDTKDFPDQHQYNSEAFRNSLRISSFYNCHSLRILHNRNLHPVGQKLQQHEELCKWKRCKWKRQIHQARHNELSGRCWNQAQEGYAHLLDLFPILFQLCNKPQLLENPMELLEGQTIQEDI